VRSTNWVNLGGIIPATNGLLTVSDNLAPGTNRFYRVILLP